MVCDGGVDAFREKELMEMCERVYKAGGTVFILRGEKRSRPFHSRRDRSQYPMKIPVVMAKAM